MPSNPLVDQKGSLAFIPWISSNEGSFTQWVFNQCQNLPISSEIGQNMNEIYVNLCPKICQRCHEHIRRRLWSGMFEYWSSDENNLCFWRWPFLDNLQSFNHCFAKSKWVGFELLKEQVTTQESTCNFWVLQPPKYLSNKALKKPFHTYLKSDQEHLDRSLCGNF